MWSSQCDEISYLATAKEGKLLRAFAMGETGHSKAGRRTSASAQQSTATTATTQALIVISPTATILSRGVADKSELAGGGGAGAT